MRFLANENVARAVVDALRARGYDTAWVREDDPASPDDERVIERARREQRLLLTFDKDFGELAFRRRLRADAGVVLFRLNASSPEQMADLVVRAIDSRDDWTGHFSVVAEGRIRMVAMPK
jgi:predicted nuclease of predicted toxin-antitoxin system